MGNEEFVKKVYLSNVEGTNRRGRPLGRWEDKSVGVCEREGSEGKWVGMGKKGVHG